MRVTVDNMSKLDNDRIVNFFEISQQSYTEQITQVILTLDMVSLSIESHMGGALQV